MSADWQTLSGLVGVTLSKFVFSAIASAARNAFQKVARIQSLRVFPIKSCGGLDVRAVRVTREGGIQDVNTGIVDRTWVIVEPSGSFVSALKSPQLFQTRCTVRDNTLVVSADGMDDLVLPLKMYASKCKNIPARVWNRTIDALDCGDEAANWFSKFTGISDVRLAHANSEHIVYYPRDDAKTKKFGMHFEDEKITFQDLAPVNLVSQESLDDIGARVSRVISNDVIRANLLVSGCTPYEEDSWRRVNIGSSKMYFVKLGTRCKRSMIDLETGQFDPNEEPNKTLNSFRYEKTYERPALSIDLGIVNEGTITVGDAVFAA